MANNVANVSTGKPKVAGSVFIGATNVQLPTSATSTISTTDFKALGYVSEDGVTNSCSIDVEKVKAWGGDTVQVLETGKEDTFTFTLIESLNADVLKAVYDDSNVTGTISGTNGMTVTVNNKEHEAKAWVIDMILKGNINKRIVIPNGTISEIGDIEYKDDTAIGYEVTIDALPDASGNTHYEYLED